MKNIKPTFELLAPYFKEGVKIAIWFSLVAVLVIFFLHAVLSIAHPYSLDYGEAPLINQAIRLASGERIYRSNLGTPPFTIANYPPLYVLSLIPFLNIFESPFQMGRIISFVATLASTIFLAMTTYRLYKDRFAAIVTGILFLSFPYVVEWSVRARIDSLALAFATAAIYVLVSWPKSRWALFGSGLLLVAAAYTRQSYALAAPLGLFVWLWTHNKKRAVQLAIMVGALGGLIFLLLNTLSDGGFAYNIITANINEFGWERLQHNLENLWRDAGIVLVLGGIFLIIAWRNLKGWPLLGPFLIGASLSALTIGKIGSNINYFLELSAALSLIGGAMIVWSGKHAWRFTLVILLLTIQMGMLMKSTMNVQVDWILTSRRLDITALRRLEQVVLDLSDPVPADEHMGMLTMNGRPLYIQTFEVSQMSRDGLWDQDPFLEDIRNHEFDGILIHHFGPFPVHRERWTPEMLAEIETNYRPTKTLAGTVVFLPQNRTEISSIPKPFEREYFDPDDAVLGPVQTATNVSQWSQVAIALNPNNLEHVALITTHTTKFDCILPNCKVELTLVISQDGGNNWATTRPFYKVDSIFYNGLVDFDGDDNLYAFGIRDNALTINSANLETGYQMSSADQRDITRSQVVAKPWFRVHPDSGQIFVTLDAQEEDMLFVTPSVLRSQKDGGPGWTTTSRADLRVSVRDFNNGRAIWPDDIQILFGEGSNLSMIWTWGWEPWTWPRTVWMANSKDGGSTFGEPTPIADTWGPINSTSANGVYSIAYRTGTEEFQRLAVATSSDNGRTWRSTIASGGVPLYFDVQVGPGIGMSPDGTIDLVFYAHDSGSLDCVQDVASWQESGPWGRRVDPCSYNVFYTFSGDGGATFSVPMRLNDDLIIGERFARFEGASNPGSHLAVASSDQYAYPAWIGTPGKAKTQVYTVQISR
jgi:hypothetical protein